MSGTVGHVGIAAEWLGEDMAMAMHRLDNPGDGAWWLEDQSVRDTYRSYAGLVVSLLPVVDTERAAHRVENEASNG